METPRQTGHTQAWVFSRTHLNTALVQSEPHLKPSALRTDRSGWRGLPLPALSPKLNKLPVKGLGTQQALVQRGLHGGPPANRPFTGDKAQLPQSHRASGHTAGT